MYSANSDGGNCSGYYAKMDWKSMTVRGKVYGIIQKKDLVRSHPIPTCYEAVMISTVTNLSTPFLPYCV